MQRSPAQPKAAVESASTVFGDVGVGHDDDVVLRAAVGLHAFAVPRAGFVDVFARSGVEPTNEIGLHLRMREQRIDALRARRGRC